MGAIMLNKLIISILFKGKEMSEQTLTPLTL